MNQSTIILIFYAALMVVAYVFYFRPQSKQRKQMEAMVNNVEVGDTIVTTSGFYGVVIDVTEGDCIVEFGNNRNCRIPMQKSAIAQVEKAEK